MLNLLENTAEIYPKRLRWVRPLAYGPASIELRPGLPYRPVDRLNHAEPVISGATARQLKCNILPVL
jgi:hypothetical protein